MIVGWGSQIADTHGPRTREYLRKVLLNGAKLVIVDPRRIDIAKRADLWIKLRPESDGALALALIKVIIEEKLYDEEFVANRTVGFDELRQHVKTFTFDDVERVTWVPRQQIEKFARMYAQCKPTYIHMGNAVSHGVHSFQNTRAIFILMAIMGPTYIPGYGVSVIHAPAMRQGTFMLLSKFPRDPKKTDGGKYAWASRTAYIPYQSLITGILEEKPRPVKAALFILSNPMITYPDSHKTYQALMKLDLVVVADIFPTPTTAIADIVLPAATINEYDAIGALEEIRAMPKLVDPPGEAWSDNKIINELAKRLGLGEYFWKDDRECLDYFLKPAGITYDELKQKRILNTTTVHLKPEEVAFKTPSGKVEIYSKQAPERFSNSPMPLWEEITRFPFQPSEEYPLLLCTRVESAYKLSSFFQVDYMRRHMPEPLVELNPETAQKAGLKEGEWIYIETKMGRIQQKLVIDADVDPRLVMAPFGWWFPDDKPSNLYGWDKSNINILLASDPAEPATGSLKCAGYALSGLQNVK